VVKRPQNFGVGLEAQRAQKYGAVELPLAVDADVEQVLVVVLKLHPTAAIGNDLAEEVALRVDAFEEDARRAMQVGNDAALGDDVVAQHSGAVTQHVADMERIGSDGGAALRDAAGRTQVMQSVEVAAIALPVSDGVVNELQLAQPTEIGDGKERIEHALQSCI